MCVQSGYRQIANSTDTLLFLEADSLSILAPVGAGAVTTLQTVDELRTAEESWASVLLDRVPPRPQRFDDAGRKSRLKLEAYVLIDIPARPVRRSLRVLPVVEDADHHLDVALWPHVPAHHAETHQGLSPGHVAKAGMIV